ncbi:hypothetical protein NQ314_021378 [Rhamnusium bicolor]|uniref:DDE Tnp4 domain-containing protein n=1 Tax=Rhamnusium bicolor TaxID=1586634 RepID=A0AAV8WJ20_9CUCU|nr:hypothetical protein NQ314_021378 [Rhamnusium bicolor]
MTRQTFENLLQKIGNKLENNNLITKGGRPTHDAVLQLMVAIWMLIDCRKRFDISLSTAWEYVYKVVDACNSIAKEVIKWPTQKSHPLSANFKNRAGIPGVIGTINGSHIPITAPEFVMQIISLSAASQCPGSIHDARMFRMSQVGSILNNNPTELIPSEYHLLGDSAYGNMAWLITPYRDNGRLTRKQRSFNYKQSSTRVCIEQTFGLLKGRFIILRHINVYRVDLIPKIIIACCVLHNICMVIIFFNYN